MVDEILIFGGSGSPKLTLKICEYLNVQPALGKCFAFRKAICSYGSKKTSAGATYISCNQRSFRPMIILWNCSSGLMR
jgi:hypothetical protein